MAENPGAISQGPGRGWGFVLDQNIASAPLRTWMQTDAINEAKKQREAARKQKVLDDSAKFLTDTGHASLLYKQKEIQKTDQYFNDQTQLMQQFQSGKLSDSGYRLKVAQLNNDIKTWKESTNQLATERDKFESALKDPTYDSEKLRTAANGLFFNPDGSLKDSPDPEFGKKAQAYLDSPEFWNKNVVTKQFFDSLQQQAYNVSKENGNITEDVAIKNKLPLLFETGANGIKQPVLDAAGHYRLDLQKTLPLVKTDPRLSKMVDAEYTQMRQQAVDQGLGEPTYQQAIEKTFADNNPVDYTHKISLDEPVRPREGDEKKKELMDAIKPTLSTHQSAVSLPVKRGESYGTGTPKTVLDTAYGYDVKSVKGTQVLNYVDLPGISSAQVSYTDGTKPDSKNTKLLDVRANRLNFGLISAGGTPVSGASKPEDLINYIKTKLTKPEDFNRIKPGIFVEGEIINKANLENDVTDTADANKQGSRQERRDPTLNSERRIRFPYSPQVKAALKTRTGHADYDNLEQRIPDEMRPVWQAYADQYRAVMAGKGNSSPASPPVTDSPLKAVAKSGRVR